MLSEQVQLRVNLDNEDCTKSASRQTTLQLRGEGNIFTKIKVMFFNEGGYFTETLNLELTQINQNDFCVNQSHQT